MKKQMTMNKLNATLTAGTTEAPMQPASNRERTIMKSKRLLSAFAALTLLALPVVALAQSLRDYRLPHHLHPFLRGFAMESMEIAREALAHGGADHLRTVEEA